MARIGAGWWAAWLVSAFSAALPGCGDDGGGAGETLGVATYNAGLAPGFVPLVEERAEVTVPAAASLPVDVLCAQELWREQDLAALLDRTADSLPAAVVPQPAPVEPEPGAPPACAAQAVEPLAACALESCRDVAPGQLTDCVLRECLSAFEATAPDCQRCLGASVAAGLEDALRTCTTGPGPRFAFDAAFGTALLADGEVLEMDTLLLESTLNRRAVLYARVDLLEVGEVHLFCTHLTPVFDVLPFPGEGSWEAELAAQVESLLGFVEQKTGGEGQILLMGDLNTGPAVGDVAAEAPENYQRLIAAGFTNPYVERPDPLCTFCADNPLVGGADRAESVIIDHVLLSGVEADVVRVARILSEPIELQVDGETVTTALSDHFGVLVELR